MAELIPGFSEDESVVIDRAARRGLLTTKHKQQIADRVLKQAQEENARPPGSIEELTGGLVTPAKVEGAVGLAGAAIGSAGGPAGAAGGAVLGTQIGAQTFETAEEVLDFIGAVDAGKSGKFDVNETLGTAQEAVGFEVAGLGAGRIAKPFFGKILGVTGEATTALLKQAEVAGLTLDRNGLFAVGAIDALTGFRKEAVQGAARVLGVFPVISGPLRRQSREKVAAGNKALTKLLAIEDFAPTVHIGEDLGIDMVKAARQSFDEFKGVAGELYDNARNLAQQTDSAFIPTTGRQMAVGVGEEAPKGIKDVAEEFLTAFKQGEITLADGTVLKGPDDNMGELLSDLTNLPDTLTISQYQKLVGDLKTFLNQAKIDGFDVKRLAQLKDGLEEGLINMREDLVAQEGLGPQIKQAFREADEFFSKGIVKFQTATGKKIARTDKNVFGAGPQIAGTLEEDEVAKVALNLKSGIAMKNLRTLVGDEVVAKASQKVFQNAFDGAVKTNKQGVRVGLDWDKFKADIGLTGDKVSREALSEMLQASGSSIQQLDNLVGVAEKIFVPLDVSEFLRRRLTIGGGASLATLFKFAGKNAGLASLAAGIAMWRGGAVLANPKHLKAMRAAIDTRTPANLKRIAVATLLDAVMTPQSDPQESIRTGLEQGADLANRGFQELRQRVQ